MSSTPESYPTAQSLLPKFKALYKQQHELKSLEEDKKELLTQLSQKERYGDNDLHVLRKLNAVTEKLTKANGEWFSTQMALEKEFPKEFIELIKAGKTLTIDEHEREQTWILKGRTKEGTLGDDVFPFEVILQN